MAFIRSSKFDSADGSFSKTIELDPAFVQAFDGRANAFVRAGNYVLAFADYHRALELDPERAEAYGYRAFAFLQIGNFERGLGDFAKQIELAPHRIDVKIHYGYMALLVGDTMTASAAFTEALRADSTNGKTYLLEVSKVFLGSGDEIQRGERLFRRIGVK